MNTQEIPFAEVQINHPISVEIVRNLLICAFEGGINYWGHYHKCIIPDGIFIENNDDLHPCYVAPFVKHCEVLIKEVEENLIHSLNLEKMKNGLQVPMLLKRMKMPRQVMYLSNVVCLEI